MAIRFEEVRKSFNTFNGSNVERRINMFEEQSTLFALNETTNFLFAKKLLIGAAKLYIDFETTSTNWNQLKEELQEEFEHRVNSSLVHQQFTNRRKKQTKHLLLEHLHEMLTIGAQCDMDIRSILSHTTNGVPGTDFIKTILYDAQNLREFKYKLETYEIDTI